MGDEVAIFGFFLNDRLVAGLPVQVRKRGPLRLARRAFATPYANLVLEPYLDTETVSLVVGSIGRVARRFSCLTVTGSPFTGPLGIGPRWQVDERATYLVNIEDLEEVQKRFGSKLCIEIRRAQKTGTCVSKGCDPEVFHRLYLQTFSRQGVTTQMTESGLRRVLETVTRHNLGRTYTVTTADGSPCIAYLTLHDEGRAYCALTGSDRTLQGPYASELLIWEIIRDYSETHKELDLVGANIPRVTDFKRKFRGELVRYTQATYYRSFLEKELIRLYQRLKAAPQNR